MDVDLELIDVIQKGIQANCLSTENHDYIFDYVDATKHKKLSKRANTDQSRKIAVGHLKSSFRSAYIKKLYEVTNVYLQNILEAVMKNGMNVNQLIGEHSINLTSKELIGLGSFDKIIEKISSATFRQLENKKDTKSLINGLDKKLGLGLTAELINNALPYFEIRHLYVHAEGIADKEFCNNYPNIRAQEGACIKLSYSLIENATQSVVALVKEIDKKVVAKELVSPAELQK